MSGPEYLASFRNAINMTSANLWLLKAAKMGLLPVAIAAALALVFLAGGVGLICFGFRKPLAGEAAPREVALRAVAGG
jgi:hypothetical protein